MIIEKMTNDFNQKQKFSSYSLGLDRKVLEFIEMKKILQSIKKSEMEVLNLFEENDSVFISKEIDILGAKKTLEIFSDRILYSFTNKIKNNFYVFLNRYGNRTYVNYKKLPPLERSSLTITLKKEMKLNEEEIFKIVGNIEELGNWIPKKGLNMIRDDMNEIWVVKTFMALDCDFEWKFVVFNRITEHCIWESRPNRISSIKGDSSLIGYWNE